MSTRRAARRDVPAIALPALLASSATLALLATGAARAQEDGGVTFLDTIAVVGTRTETSVQDNPASVTVVGKEEIARKSADGIAELLRDVPGVEVVDSSAPGMKRLSIRGESSRRVTVLIDGQEVTDHSDYGTPILIDPSNVERIEVVRGPASVLHGAKAIGGVVNIITKRGAAKPVQAEIGGTYYSGTDGWQGWAAASGTVGDFDYRISGSLDDHGDRRVPNGQYTSTGRLDGTSFGNDNLSAHLGYTFGDAGNHYIALKATQHRLWSESWTDPATLDPTKIRDFKIDLPKRDLRKVGLYYDGTDISDIVRKVHFDAYYQEVDRLFTNEATMVPPTPSFRTVSEDVNTNWGATAQVDLQFHPDHYTIVGLHFLDDVLDSSKTTTTTLPNGVVVPGVPVTDDASIRTISAFAQNEWSFADDFKLTAGARYYSTRTDLAHTSDPERQDYAGRSDGRFVTSLGLTYTGIENTTLRALYSEGYITPTLFQLFSDSIARERIIFGNPDLKPETSRNVEFGARYDAGGLMLDATAFYSEAQDYIARAACAPIGSASCPDRGTAPEKFIYANVDKARTYGVELAAEYTLPGTQFTPYANAAWMRRELTSGSFSTYHSNTPALSGRMGLRWEGEMAGGTVWTDLFVRAATEVKELEEGSPLRRLPGYGTLNFAFGGSFGDDDKYRFGVSFNNILNKEYRSSFDEIPGVGRSVEVMARMKF